MQPFKVISDKTGKMYIVVAFDSYNFILVDDKNTFHSAPSNYLQNGFKFHGFVV